MAQIDDKTAPETADKGAMSVTENSGPGERFEPVRVRTPLAVGEVLERVTALSKRGKLPGFAPRGDGGGEGGGERGFVAAVHGKPFDSELVCQVREVGDEGGDECGDGSEIDTGVRLKRGLPAVFGVVVVLSIWPGVLLTDSLMNTWFSWYPNETWKTYAWYLPLTVIPLPWMVRKVMRQSRASGAQHAAEQVGKIAKAVDGTVQRGD
ncbi:MAG: hypothetical protein ACI89L_000877 [Phycisphaerales bacterium]|jgi:hypothetical protein